MNYHKENIKYYLYVLDNFDKHYRDFWNESEELSVRDTEQLKMLIELLKKDIKNMITD